MARNKRWSHKTGSSPLIEDRRHPAEALRCSAQMIADESTLLKHITYSAPRQNGAYNAQDLDKYFTLRECPAQTVVIMAYRLSAWGEEETSGG